MGKKVEEQKPIENSALGVDLDMEELDIPMVETPIDNAAIEPKIVKKNKKPVTEKVYNCLRNERVTVRYIPKLNGIWGNNPKHVLAGGMSENSSKVYVVPRLGSGVFVNVLTDNEKAFLEDIMGLEYNALSIYKKTDNFWDDGNNLGINKVKLSKQDNFLNLSDPEDYIRYKILLANKDFIAPSLKELQDHPKATYQYVIIEENEETKSAKLNMSITMQCYKEFGKIENDIDSLRTIIETVDGRPTSRTVKLEFLQTKANELIQSNSKLFLKIITDPLLPTKVLIKKCIEEGIIYARGTHLHLRSDNTPLCEKDQEPTLNIAAQYLNNPRHQDILFMLQAKLKA